MSAGEGSSPLDSARYRKAPYPEPQLAVDARADGTLLLSGNSIEYAAMVLAAD